MFNYIINWLVDNCEWVFSGIGVTILLGIITFIRKKVIRNRQDTAQTIINQENGGNHNTQIGIQNNYYGEKRDDR